MNKYLIWSVMHRKWRGPPSHGYTDNVARAGQYSRDDAIWICRGSLTHDDNTSLLIPLRLEDAMDAGLAVAVGSEK